MVVPGGFKVLMSEVPLYLIERIYQLVLESQIPYKTVNWML